MTYIPLLYLCFVAHTDLLFDIHFKKGFFFFLSICAEDYMGFIYDGLYTMVCIRWFVYDGFEPNINSCSNF
jgi:hypothetical protein